MENEWSDSQRAATAANNTNMTTWITVVPTKLDEVLEVVIYIDINREVEPEPLVDKGTFHYIERDSTSLVETMG